MPPTDLSVEIAHGKRSLSLRNPITVASGTFSYGTDYANRDQQHRYLAPCGDTR